MRTRCCPWRPWSRSSFSEGRAPQQTHPPRCSNADTVAGVPEILPVSPCPTLLSPLYPLPHSLPAPHRSLPIYAYCPLLPPPAHLPITATHPFLLTVPRYLTPRVSADKHPNPPCGLTAATPRTLLTLHVASSENVLVNGVLSPYAHETCFFPCCNDLTLAHRPSERCALYTQAQISSAARRHSPSLLSGIPNTKMTLHYLHYSTS